MSNLESKPKHGHRLVPRVLRFHLLRIVTPMLIALLGVFVYSSFRYFRDFYSPGLRSSFQGGDRNTEREFDVWVDLDAKIEFEKSARFLRLVVEDIVVEVQDQARQRLVELCVENLLFSWETFGKVREASRVIWSPICLPLDSAHISGRVQDSTEYLFDISELPWRDNTFGQGSYDFGVLYPFDQASYRFMMWLSYSTTYGNSTMDTGVLSPDLSIGGLENIMQGNWEVQVSGEYEDVGIEGVEDLPDHLLGQVLETRSYTVDFRRPFVLRYLYVVVFITVVGFVLVTFFMKKTEIYLSSILVLLFGLLSIKQLFPLPAELDVYANLTDLLLLFSYIAIGISAIHFIVHKYLQTPGVQASEAASGEFETADEQTRKL